MAYGIKIKNRSEDTIIGTSNLSLKFVASGYQAPEYQDSDFSSFWYNTGTTLNSHTISYPSGANRHNSFIFAKPVVTTFPGEGGSQHDILKQGTWPMGVRFDSNGFSLITDHHSVERKMDEGRHTNKKSYWNSDIMWGNHTNFSFRVKVYWELWTIGNEEDEGSNHGMQVKTAGQDIIYSSDRKVIRPESSSYTTPGIDWSEGADSNFEYAPTNPARLYMSDLTENAQLEYLALLNGTAHTVGYARGGHTSSTTGQIGNQLVAYGSESFAQNLVSWHYFEQEDLFGREPYCEWGGTLVYYKTPSTTENDLRHLIRTGNTLGVKTLALIGVVR